MIDWPISIFLEASADSRVEALYREAAALYAKTGDPRTLKVSEVVVESFRKKHPEAPKHDVRIGAQKSLLAFLHQALATVVLAVPGVARRLEEIAAQDERREVLLSLGRRIGVVSLRFFDGELTAEEAKRLADASFPRCSKLFETLAESPYTRLGLEGTTPSEFFQSVLETLYGAVYRKTDFARGEQASLRRRN